MNVHPNPPPGAILHYHLAAAPKDDIKIEIIDAKGAVIRTLTSKKPPPSDTDLEASWSQFKEPDPLPKSAGLHRVVWNLRHEGATVIPGAKFDSGQPHNAFLAAPGAYGGAADGGRQERDGEAGGEAGPAPEGGRGGGAGGPGTSR